MATQQKHVQSQNYQVAHIEVYTIVNAMLFSGWVGRGVPSKTNNKLVSDQLNMNESMATQQKHVQSQNYQVAHIEVYTIVYAMLFFGQVVGGGSSSKTNNKLVSDQQNMNESMATQQKHAQSTKLLGFRIEEVFTMQQSCSFYFQCTHTG